MTNLNFQTELKKDFYEVQESITTKHDAYDYYCALKIAEKSIVRYHSSDMLLKNMVYSLEKLREYFLSIMLLDFMDVSLITLNNVESKIYTTALNGRLAKLEKELTAGKVKKEALEGHKDEIQLIKIMLDDVRLE